MAAAICVGGCDTVMQLVDQLPRRKMDAPPDLPDWSKSEYVRWASVRTDGERALIIDVGGGTIDSYLDDEGVSDLLNDEFRSIFLHPRARPDLTAHLGWPSITLVDDKGCVRATGSPSDAAAAVELMRQALAARAAGEESSLPARKLDVPTPPPGGGTWTADDPEGAVVFVQPNRGAPAVIWDERPWVFGNRSDAELLVDRPAAQTFLEDVIKPGFSYLTDEGPILKCPLPIPAPPAPPEPDPETEGDQPAEAQAPAGG